MGFAENAAKKQQRGRPFQKGMSGNPHGKPVGTRNKLTLAAEAFLEGEADQLTRKAVELALGGDVTALRLCLERIVAPRRDRPIQFQMPKLTTASDALSALSAIAGAVAQGELSDGEARTLIGIVDSFREVLSTVDHSSRLSAIEQQLANETPTT